MRSSLLALASSPSRRNGGNVAEAIFTAITMGFLAAIAWMLYILSRQNQLTLATLSDGRRAILYGALGHDRAADRRHRQALLHRRRHARLDPAASARSVAAIWRIWIEANTY